MICNLRFALLIFAKKRIKTQYQQVPPRKKQPTAPPKTSLNSFPLTAYQLILYVLSHHEMYCMLQRYSNRIAHARKPFQNAYKKKREFERFTQL